MWLPLRMDAFSFSQTMVRKWRKLFTQQFRYLLGAINFFILRKLQLQAWQRLWCLTWRVPSLARYWSIQIAILSTTGVWGPLGATFYIGHLALWFCCRPNSITEASKSVCAQVEGLGNPKKVEFHAGHITLEPALIVCPGNIFLDSCIPYIFMDLYIPLIYFKLIKFCRSPLQSDMRG